MSLEKNKKKIWLALALIFILFMGFLFALTRGKKRGSQPEQLQSSTSQTPRQTTDISSSCKQKPELHYAPMKLTDINYIEPMGLVIDSHITPIDHTYFVNKGQGQSETDYPVYNILAGTVTSIQRFKEIVSDRRQPIDDYRLVIRHHCNLESIYIHVKKISEKLAQALGENDYKGVRVAVADGEVLGWMGKNRSFDFSMADYSKQLKGFVNPQSYAREPWKIHTIDPLELFSEPLKSQLEAKSLRDKPPYGGKIDWDIKGKLVGNWFEQGTHGYKGTKKNRYWDGHLAFVYNHLDHDFIVVSIGNFGGKNVQKAVSGNAPDPGEVDEKSGVVKYELVDFDYYLPDGARARYPRYSKHMKPKANERAVAGTVLAQVLPNNRIKFEAFVGKRKEQVSGFSDKAKIYER